MTSNLKISLVCAQAQAVVVAPLCNSGYLDVYATSQPATPETAPGGAALVTLPLPATFAASIAAGVITANAITAQTIANSGTALWFRVTESDHSTPVFDGNVGTASTDMIVNATSLVAGATFTVSSLTFTVPGV